MRPPCQAFQLCIRVKRTTAARARTVMGTAKLRHFRGPGTVVAEGGSWRGSVAGGTGAAEAEAMMHLFRSRDAPGRAARASPYFADARDSTTRLTAMTPGKQGSNNSTDQFLAKASYTCKMNGLAQARFGLFRPDSGYDRVALTFLGWMVSAFRARQDLVLENLALHPQLLALHAQRPDHRSTGKGGAGVAFAWM